MKILIKYPSRGRPDAFFAGLDSIVQNLHDASNVAVWVTCDIDDPCWHAISKKIKIYYNTFTVYEDLGYSDSKIHAINRGIPPPDSDWCKWDIIMVMSDDFRITSLFFDKIIRDQFADGDFDKLSHLPDDTAGAALATMYIAGKTFYNRFGYVYHPSYHSLFCDNEIMEVAQSLGKYYYVDYPGVIQHLNPAYGGYKDEMFIEQQRIGYTRDQDNYLKRKAERLGCTTDEALIDYMQKFNERK